MTKGARNGNPSRRFRRSGSKSAEPRLPEKNNSCECATGSAARLGWVRIHQEDVFEGEGRQPLAELLAGRRKLIVCNLMFDPGWDETLQELPFPGRKFQRGPGPSQAARCEPRGDFPSAIREARRFSEGDGRELQLGVVSCQLQPRSGWTKGFTRRRSHFQCPKLRRPTCTASSLARVFSCTAALA